MPQPRLSYDTIEDVDTKLKHFLYSVGFVIFCGVVICGLVIHMVAQHE